MVELEWEGEWYDCIVAGLIGPDPKRPQISMPQTREEREEKEMERRNRQQEHGDAEDERDAGQMTKRDAAVRDVEMRDAAGSSTSDVRRAESASSDNAEKRTASGVGGDEGDEDADQSSPGKKKQDSGKNKRAKDGNKRAKESMHDDGDEGANSMDVDHDDDTQTQSLDDSGAHSATNGDAHSQIGAASWPDTHDGFGLVTEFEGYDTGEMMGGIKDEEEERREAMRREAEKREQLRKEALAKKAAREAAKNAKTAGHHKHTLPSTSSSGAVAHSDASKSASKSKEPDVDMSLWMPYITARHPGPEIVYPDDWPEDSIFVCEEDDRPIDVARKYRVNLDRLVRLNKKAYPALQRMSLLKKGTQLRLPLPNHVRIADSPPPPDDPLNLGVVLLHYVGGSETETEWVFRCCKSMRPSGDKLWNAINIESSEEVNVAMPDPAAWKKHCRKVLKRISKHEKAWPFWQAVDPQSEEAAEYYKVITKPMWLDRIEEKMDREEYASAAEFADDMRLVFDNAKLFNSAEHMYHKHAETLAGFFDASFAAGHADNNWGQPYLNPPPPPPAKVNLLRHKHIHAYFVCICIYIYIYIYIYSGAYKHTYVHIYTYTC